MSYDTWKSTEPDPPHDGPFGECDCCGQKRPLSRCWPMGIETYACDECRGEENTGD